MLNLKNKTLSGLFWSLLGRFGEQGAQFIISVILARLLLPEDFGIVVMVLVIIAYYIYMENKRKKLPQ